MISGSLRPLGGLGSLGSLATRAFSSTSSVCRAESKPGVEKLASIVVVVTGANRSGIVADLCSKVFSPHKANIGRTRMSTLGTDFGLLAHAVMPEGQVEALKSSLERTFPDFVTGVSLQASLHPEIQTKNEGRRIRISMIGPDDVGLLGSLSKCLSENKCDIYTLSSESQAAAHTGEEMFIADVAMRLPTDVPREKLHEEVVKLGEKLGVEITIHDLP